METILVKIFATALALSEVMTEPQAVKTHFDPVADRNQVLEILRAGCPAETPRHTSDAFYLILCSCRGASCLLTAWGQAVRRQRH